MNVVRWINDSEMELSIDSSTAIKDIRDLGYRLYKHPQSGTRKGTSFYYLRLSLDNEYSNGAYSFPVNEKLEQLCISLNKLDFVFWGTFKTEIAPFDYMKNLQKKGVLKADFKSIQAGNNEVVIEAWKNN